MKRKRVNIESMSDAAWRRLIDEVAGPPAERPIIKPDPRYTETHYGLTPSGGDYSVAYYYDKEGNPCRKQEAASVNIVEYSKDGERINETYAQLL